MDFDYAEVGNDSLGVATTSQVEQFDRQGFLRFDHAFSQRFVEELNSSLERVLRGHYDQGIAPDKAPQVIRGDTLGPLGFAGDPENSRVMHLINIWRSDSTFAQLILSLRLGHLVASLAGWETGACVAQDQVWAKPPGAPPLVFHRDSPYFFFDSDEAPEKPRVITAWIALDDMEQELGPLEYVVGSHCWDVGRAGSASAFFQQQPRQQLLAAAARAGVAEEDLEIVSMCGLRAGGLSIHHGCCWHGSGPNSSSSRPRRGIGIHYVPGSAKFTEQAARSKVWSPYMEADGLELNRSYFPLVTSRDGIRMAMHPENRAALAQQSRVYKGSKNTSRDPNVLSSTEKKRLGHYINGHKKEWNVFVISLGQKPNFSFKSCPRSQLLRFCPEQWQDFMESGDELETSEQKNYYIKIS